MRSTPERNSHGENALDFTAIDVETANPDMASICQIGLARFSGGSLVYEWTTLIDPEDDFAFMNVCVHGIDEDMVVGMPKLPDVVGVLREHLEGTVAVCHTHFDRIALHRGLTKYGLPTIETRWLDSARVVRRTWPEMAWRGYGLGSVCDKIGYRFQHHDALEDAKAAGHVLLAAMRESQLDLEGWIRRVEKPIDLTSASGGEVIRREGNPEGDLFGQVVVFTGALDLPRREAADLAASIGCQVAPSVTANTTLLVVGDQDIAKLAGHEKSTKHRKAEELIAKGQPIRIISERDFKLLFQLAHVS